MRWSNAIDFSDFQYDAVGRMTKATNPYAVVTRTYDDAGRLLTDQQTLTASFNAPANTLPPPASIVSRQVHGSAGTFDIPLSLAGGTTECRTGGATHNYTLVLTFADPPWSAAPRFLQDTAPSRARAPMIEP